MDMILMHKDIPTAYVNIINNIPVSFSEIISKDNLPVGVFSEHQSIQNRLINAWYKTRSIPNGRQGLQRIQSVLGVTPEKGFLSSLGVSLTDTYWFKPKDSNLTWADVNFHDNGFVPVFALAKEYICVKDIKSPDFTTDGIMDKYWYSSGGVPCLAKFDSEFNGCLAANEVVASKIAKELQINAVNYAFGGFDRNGTPSCDCPCFVYDSDTDFVTALQVSHSDFALTGLSLVKYFEDRFPKEINDVCILDVLLCNIDRHEKNIGYLQTKKGDYFAPIFDTGSCLNYSKSGITDMRFFRKTREELAERISCAPNINSTYFYDVLQDVYEEFRIPEECYNRAKITLQEGISLLGKRKIQSYAEEWDLEL